MPQIAGSETLEKSGWEREGGGGPSGSRTDGRRGPSSPLSFSFSLDLKKGITGDFTGGTENSLGKAKNNLQ